MHQNSNPYTLRTETVEGITHYFVSFIDGQAIHRETEVSRPIYMEILRFVKDDRNLTRWDERHTEQSDLTDKTLNKRALSPTKSLEETILDNLQSEELQRAIQGLPETQRRRLILYYELGLTYEKIADMEGCTKRAVKFSVDLATEKIKEHLKLF